MKNPDVSIIITNYNYEKFISRCIRSCLSQKNVSHEIIVVDDCSENSPQDILEALKSIVTGKHQDFS